MKRSYLTKLLYGTEAVANLEDKNPKIFLTDGVDEWEILSIYSAGPNDTDIYIDIGVKDV